MSERIRGCYLHYCDVMDPKSSLTGIDRKVLSQIKMFSDAGLECDFRYCRRPTSFFGKAISCLPFMPDGVDWPSPCELGDLDFLYIRRPVYISATFLKFLRGFRAKNPHAIVLYEIPTYPYDAEMGGFNSVALIKDKHHRSELNGLIDYIVDLGGRTEIFGLPTIQITNGIDFDVVSRRKASLDGNAVNVLAVAAFSPWHGVDRFIEGMAKYYEGDGSRNVVLHLAGGGSELDSLQSLVRSRGLEDHVVFYGHLGPVQLEPLYGQSDLGIECLGIHRRAGLQRSASIKSREYLAKGLPFIYSAPIDGIEDGEVDFCKRMPPDESPIDLEDVLIFRDGLYEKEDPNELAERMRLYGQGHISMKAAMKNVLQLLGAHELVTEEREDGDHDER